MLNLPRAHRNHRDHRDHHRGLRPISFAEPACRTVGSMMNKMEYPRATALGIASNPPLDQIVLEYIDDYWKPPAPKTVGFIGIGFMGSGMVRNLAKAGFEVVIYNRTASKAQAIADEFVNVKVVGSPAEVAAAANVVSICLASEAQTEAALYAAETGVMATMTAQHILLDHSTVSPACTAKTAKACADKGARFLDAPISGGPEGAANGTLAIMCGGDQATFDDVGAVLDAMGACIELMGATGSGTATKLVNQLLVGIHATASAEAFQLGKKLGITDVGKLLGVLNQSWGQSRILTRCGGFIAQVEEKQDPSILNTSGAPLRNLYKDLSFVKTAAEGVGLNTPVTDAARDQYTACMEAGLSEADIAVPYNRLD